MVSGKDLFSVIGDYKPFTEKELLYGVWRARLTKSSSEGEIRQSVIDGTNALIDLGYSDMAHDFFPFITVLMEEQHIYNYDLTRTSGFSKGSRGIVTSLEYSECFRFAGLHSKIWCMQGYSRNGQRIDKTDV